MELPPRARRIHEILVTSWRLMGTTSACAENTVRHAVGVIFAGNYLRVRGEYISLCAPNFPMRELPPRARRIQHFPYPTRVDAGTTSACAENTFFGR